MEQKSFYPVAQPPRLRRLREGLRRMAKLRKPLRSTPSMRLQSRSTWTASYAKLVELIFHLMQSACQRPSFADKGIEGVPLTKIPIESFMHSITTYTRSHFLT